MSDVQTVQPDQGANPPVDPAANPQGADTAQTSEASNGAAEEKRKRRKLNADDVKLFHDIESLANQGESIPWSQLPIEIKRSVIPSSNRTKLIDKEIIDVKVNEDTGTIESISIDPEIAKAFEFDLTWVPPSTVAREAINRTRRPRSEYLTDPKYMIQKLTDENPRRIDTAGFYNWEHCYKPDMSVTTYLDFMDYPRDIKTNKGTAWFNGPSTIHLHADVKNGSIRIYDSSMPRMADGRIDPLAVVQIAAVLTATEQANTTESDEESESNTSETPAAK